MSLLKVSSFLFIITLCLPVQAQESPTLADKTEFIDGNVYEFSQEIEKQAMLYFEQHKAQLPNIKRTTWEKMVRVTLKQYHENLLRMKAVARFASPAAKTFVFTNIMSTFVLPPILTALGQPGLAFLVLAIPFEPVVAAGQVILMQFASDLRLIKNIGYKDYKDLKQLRKELLGLSNRKGIVTVLQKDLQDTLRQEEGTRWLVISKGSKNSEIASHELQVTELEKIVKSKREGAEFLKELKQERISQEFYALELWNFLQEDVELKGELQKLLNEKSLMSTGNGVLLVAERRELRIVKTELMQKQKTLSWVLQELKNSPGFSVEMMKSIEALRLESEDLFRDVIISIETAELNLDYMRRNGIPSKINFKDDLEIGTDLIDRQSKLLYALATSKIEGQDSIKDFQRVLFLEGDAEAVRKKFDKKFQDFEKGNKKLSLQMHQARDLKRKLLDREDEVADAFKQLKKAVTTTRAERKELKQLLEDLKDTTQKVLNALGDAENHILLSKLNGENTSLDLGPMLELGDKLNSRFSQLLQKAPQFAEDRTLKIGDLRKIVGLELGSESLKETSSSSCSVIWKALKFGRK